MTPLAVIEWTVVTFIVFHAFFAILGMFDTTRRPRKKKK